MADLNTINELVGEKKFDEVKPLIEDALLNDKYNAELLKLAGLTYINLKEWKSAQNCFETVVKQNQEDASSWFYLANCYERQGDFITAKNAYLKVLELRPESTDTYKNLCALFIKLREHTNAIKYAETALKIDESDYIFDFLIGTALMDSKKFEEAIVPLNKALEKEPDKPEILNSLGTCYMALGNADKAIEIYNKVLQINPDNAVAYFNLGSVYQIKQKHEQAVKYFQKAAELDEDEKYLSSLAMSEVKIGDFDCALKHYKQLATLCPNKENYKYNMVICYDALGDTATAIKLLEGMIYLNPKFILPAQKLADLYMKTNQLNKAKEIYDKILLKNKITPETLHKYAILSSSLCDTDTAERMLKKVIRMNPEIAKAHKDLAIIYLNKRLFDYAKDEFETAMKLAPNDFEILFEYGNYLYSVSKNSEAERYYTEALEIEPNNVLALVFMALNKLVMNQLDAAYDYIMKALKLEPEHEYVQFCAGKILYARGEYDEAKRYLIKAVEQNPDIESLNTLALTYFKLEDYKQALNIFASINKKHPNSIPVMMNIAKCYEALGENDSALVYLNKVTDVFPENEEAQEMIRKLS